MLPPARTDSRLDGPTLADRTLRFRSEAGRVSAEPVERNLEARPGGRVSVRLPVVAGAGDNSRSQESLDQPATSLLADLVSEFVGDCLESDLGQWEPLPLVRSGSEQVSQDVERQPSVRVVELTLLLARQAQVGDTTADDVRNDLLEGRRGRHLGDTAGYYL